MPQTDAEDAVALLRQVSTAALTGRLYKEYGMRSRAVAGVRALDEANCRFAGPAFTLRYIPQREDMNEATDLAHPDSLMQKAMEDIPAGAVFVIDMQRTTHVGALGDVLVTRLIDAKAAGVVADGGMRDVAELRGMGLPIFCAGPAAPPGPMAIMPAGLQQPVGCGGVAIFPGDYIVADEDGVVAVPRAIAIEVARKCIEKERMDTWSRMKVAEGGGVRGRYPPDQAHLAMYKAWLTTQER